MIDSGSRKSRSQLLRRVLSAIQQSGAFSAGERVGVCVSGGADSVALLLLLLDLRRTLGIVLSVVHFNHQLRGKASDADEKFVARFAAKNAITLHLGRGDVAAKAKREKANLEDAARRARYLFFAQLVAQGKLTRLAVAHTADDQAETVLAHILRGTGLAGLGGIHPTAGHVVRPLLQIRRADLRAYLKECKQTWREDATNRDLTRTRARIRKNLIPLLQKHFQPAAVEHLVALADLAREDEAYLDAIAKERAAAIVKNKSGETSVSVEDLLGMRAKNAATSGGLALPKRVVRNIVQDLKRQAGQLGAPHVYAILDLAKRGKNGNSLPLPGGLEVLRERNRLIFRSRTSHERASARNANQFEHSLDINRPSVAIEVPSLARLFRFTTIEWPAHRNKTTSAALDRDALRLPLVLRDWRPGDRLRPAGHRKAHKLKRLLNERRVGRSERNGWPVLTSAGTLVWARGFPVAADFAPRDGTRIALLVSEEPL